MGDAVRGGPIEDVDVVDPAGASVARPGVFGLPAFVRRFTI